MSHDRDLWIDDRFKSLEGDLEELEGSGAKDSELNKVGSLVDNNSWGYVLGWEFDEYYVWNDGEEFWGAYELELVSPIDAISIERNILFVHSAGNDGDAPGFAAFAAAAPDPAAGCAATHPETPLRKTVTLSVVEGVEMTCPSSYNFCNKGERKWVLPIQTQTKFDHWSSNSMKSRRVKRFGR